MQTGSTLKIVTTPIDLGWVAEMCLVYGTQCEVPGCPNSAVAPFLSRYALAFVCILHDEYIKSLRNPVDFGLKVAHHLKQEMLKKSYVHQNNSSGFELEKKVAALHDGIQRTDVRKREAAREEVRAARKAFADANLRIGAPDDALLRRRTGRVSTSRRTGRQPIMIEPVHMIGKGADLMFPPPRLF